MNQHLPESKVEPSDDPVAVPLSRQALAVRFVHPDFYGDPNSGREWIIHFPIIDGLVWWSSMRCPFCNAEPEVREEPQIVSIEPAVRREPPSIGYMVRTPEKRPSPREQGTDALPEPSDYYRSRGG